VERDALLTVAVATAVAAAWRASSVVPRLLAAVLALAAAAELFAAAYLPWPPWTRGPLALHATSIVGKLAALGRATRRERPRPRLSAVRLLAYAFLWPGLEAEISFRRDPAAPRARGARSLAAGVLEVALAFGLARVALSRGWLDAPEPFPSWLRAASFVALLDGSFRAFAGAMRALGLFAEDLFREPWLARDLAELWSRRWNRFVGRTIALDVYAPVRARAGRFAAVLAAFLMSGVFHEVLFGLPAWTDGRYVAFFLAHGVATLAIAGLAGGDAPARRVLARAASWAVLLATAPLFFGGPYPVVLPIERAWP
jgi:hypothetical protein